MDKEVIVKDLRKHSESLLRIRSLKTSLWAQRIKDKDINDIVLDVDQNKVNNTRTRLESQVPSVHFDASHSNETLLSLLLFYDEFSDT